MVIHLHEYDKDCNVNICPYCSYHRIRNVRIYPELEKNLQDSMFNSSFKLAEEIGESITFISGKNRGKILVTNIATNSFGRLKHLFDHLSKNCPNLSIQDNLLIKTTTENFGKNTIECRERINWINFRPGIEVDSIKGFDHIILIDDVYSTGCSYQIAKFKLEEIGISPKIISLITILKVNTIDLRQKKSFDKFSWIDIKNHWEDE